MNRPTKNELMARIKDAHQHVPTGAFYRHQASGGLYEVTGHRIREYDGAVLVSYTCGLVPFSRPLDEFNEIITLPSGATGPRFIPVSWEEASLG